MGKFWGRPPLAAVPAPPTTPPTPLAKYSFENLSQTNFSPLPIELTEKISQSAGFSSWIFKFETQEGKISGLINIPQICAAEKCPAVVMIRGYVEKEIYRPGVGTKKAGEAFAENGFVTLAPDFLGFGLSDAEGNDDIRNRLIRPASVVQLLSSVSEFKFINQEKLFLWGHSNGGQIALAVLAITAKPIPTSVWAPVSKPFPYSILYYTDEADDHGKYLRKITADFEKIYDPEQFSLPNFLGRINAPIQIHQGTRDESVPWRWSMELVKTFQSLKKDARLFEYSGADHNLQPGWNLAISRDIDFFRSKQPPRPAPEKSESIGR